MPSRPSTRPAQTPRGGLDLAALFTFCLLMAAPTYALIRMSAHIHGGILLGLSLGLSLVSLLAYRGDKRRAGKGAWRTPEATLHLLALLGGWPGAFLAQRLYRHKTSKLSFQIVFWIIVLLHQFAAIDYLLRWQLVRAIGRALMP